MTNYLLAFDNLRHASKEAAYLLDHYDADEILRDQQTVLDALRHLQALESLERERAVLREAINEGP